jgi:uncharacterized protein
VEFLNNLMMKKALIALLKAYQSTLSPILRTWFGKGCRFTPTCSHYTIEALEKFGVAKGLSLGFKRFLKCHPFGSFGHDPVPVK